MSRADVCVIVRFFSGQAVTSGGFFCVATEQGAATSCYVALHLGAKGVSGRYFCDSNVYEPSEKAKDAELAKKLWDFSVELVT